MATIVFILSLGALFAVAPLWAFKQLPKERWQILASVPAGKTGDGQWSGTNYTYYGFFSATAYVIALAVFFVLLGAADIHRPAAIAAVAAILAVCVPSSRIVARIVEKKRNTFTVGGAVFVGTIISPMVILLVNALLSPFGIHLPLPPVLAALAIAYAFAEGFGRLACLSFGCCYGKPAGQSPGYLRWLARIFPITFEGKLKKAAYAGNLEGAPLIPVQGMTYCVYISTGLLAAFLWLNGYFTGALALSISVTQLWRFYSETLRADHRGEGTISAYQKMSLTGLIFALALAWLLGTDNAIRIDTVRGLDSLWSPSILLFLQAVWIVIFLYTGKSAVTGAKLEFHIHSSRV